MKSKAKQLDEDDARARGVQLHIPTDQRRKRAIWSELEGRVAPWCRFSRMPDEATIRLPNRNWFGPIFIVGAVALIVHLARPSSGTMFDDDNFGGTFWGLAVSVIGLVSGYFMTRSTLRNVILRGPCPRCGAVAVR
ncbi:MAG: hypothetical protein ABI467_01645, partial [Kofleriaceae bacterium]